MGNLFTRLFGNTTTTVKSSARRKPSVRSAVRLGVEDLEERCVPTTTYTWTGASSTAWENSGNWSGNPGHYPGDSGTSAISDIAVTASGTNGPPTISTANIKILQLDENTNYPNVPQVDVSNGKYLEVNGGASYVSTIRNGIKLEGGGILSVVGTLDYIEGNIEKGTTTGKVYVSGDLNVKGVNGIAYNPIYVGKDTSGTNVTAANMTLKRGTGGMTSSLKLANSQTIEVEPGSSLVYENPTYGVDCWALGGSPEIIVYGNLTTSTGSTNKVPNTGVQLRLPNDTAATNARVTVDSYEGISFDSAIVQTGDVVIGVGAHFGVTVSFTMSCTSGYGGNLFFYGSNTSSASSYLDGNLVLEDGTVLVGYGIGSNHFSGWTTAVIAGDFTATGGAISLGINTATNGQCDSIDLGENDLTSAAACTLNFIEYNGSDNSGYDYNLISFGSHSGAAFSQPAVLMVYTQTFASGVLDLHAGS